MQNIRLQLASYLNQNAWLSATTKMILLRSSGGKIRPTWPIQRYKDTLKASPKHFHSQPKYRGLITHEWVKWCCFLRVGADDYEATRIFLAERLGHKAGADASTPKS